MDLEELEKMSPFALGKKIRAMPNILMERVI